MTRATATAAAARGASRTSAVAAGGATPRVAGTRRHAPGPAPGAAPSAHPLRLVQPIRTGAPRAPFVVLVGTLLTGGLAGLLFLHTALAEDSFRLQDLKNRSAALAAREQALEQEVAREAAPKQLAARAEALGMVRSVNPAFIRLSDGSVLGRPRPGVAPPPPPARAADRAGTESATPAAGPAGAGNRAATPAPNPTAGAEVTPAANR